MPLYPSTGFIPVYVSQVCSNTWVIQQYGYTPLKHRVINRFNQTWDIFLAYRKMGEMIYCFFWKPFLITTFLLVILMHD